MVIPVILLLPELHDDLFGGLSVAISGAYVGIVPMASLVILKFSQQWQAADLFRAAPVAGPAPFCHGGRRAVLLLLGLPAVAVEVVMVWIVHGQPALLLLLLPGLVTLPTYSMLPVDDGQAVPLSLPTDEVKSTGRGLYMLGAMVVSVAIAALAVWSRRSGWFWGFLLGESVIALGLYAAMRYKLAKAPWPPIT
jgi:hypothetical protein